MRRLLTLLLPMLALLAAPLARAASDPAEVELTWTKGYLYVPGEGGMVEAGRMAASLERMQANPPAKKLPAVVYAHGCDGVNGLSRHTAAFLAEAGYAVFIPDSFARKVKPKSCNPATAEGGFHRAVLGWRHEEVDLAITKVRALPWIDPDRVFLFGLSEGAVTAATYKGQRLAGRVIEGWTCHAGWPEYRGLAAPPDEPVLSFVGEDDPWFQADVMRGDCGEYMKPPLQKSVVLRYPSPRASIHEQMFGSAENRALALQFLRNAVPGAQ